MGASPLYRIYDAMIGIGYSYAFLRKPIEQMTLTESSSGVFLATDGLRILFSPEGCPSEEDVQLRRCG